MNQTKSQQLLDYIRAHGSARTDVMGVELEIPTSTVSALLARYVLDGTLVSCKVERPGQAPVNEYRYSVASGGRVTVYQDIVKPKPGALPALDAQDALARGGQFGRKAGADTRERKNGVEHQAAGSTVLDDKWLGDQRARQDTPASERATNAAPDPLADVPRIGAIEVGVPMPPQTGLLRRAFADMQPAESRLITGYTTKCIYNTAARVRMKVLVRPEGAGYRVWRVA